MLVSFIAKKGREFGFVANCGWGQGFGSKVAQFLLDLVGT
jgi:hypothetical protein